MLSSIFFKDSQLSGSYGIHIHPGNYRYWRIRFGSPLKNEISSFYGHRYGDRKYRIITYSGSRYNGKFLGLNIDNNWAQINYVGGYMNDTIESALLVRRSPTELNFNLKSKLTVPWKAKLNDVLAGTPARRNGDPKFRALMWPGHAPNKKLVRIEQKLKIDVPYWSWDYDATIRYDIYLYLSSSGKLRGHVTHYGYWIEGGVMTSKIADVLVPEIVSGASKVNEALQDELDNYSFFDFKGMYLLPGNPPSSSLWYSGHSNDNATLVLSL